MMKATILTASLLLLLGYATAQSEPAIIALRPVEFEAVAHIKAEQVSEDFMWMKWYNEGGVIGHIRAKNPAFTKITIPQSGPCYVWVRYSVHPIRAKSFSLLFNGLALPFAWLPYGENADERPDIYNGAIEPPNTRGQVWTRQEIDLPGGDCTLELTTLCEPPHGAPKATRHPPAVWEIRITHDQTYTPEH